MPQYIKIDGKDEFYPVTDMGVTFMRCDKLVTAPEIPETVVTMWSGWLYGTFYDCTNLRTAPMIPPKVTNMSYTFFGCTNLTGKLIINVNPKDYKNCLGGASTADDANLVVSGSSTVLDEIIATKSDNSHITKGN